MACTACQNVTTQQWQFWQKFCDQVYEAQYPETIPLTTAIPHWAFLTYTVCILCWWWGTKSSISYFPGSQANDTFDPVAAKAAGDGPETLAPVPSTVSLSSGPTNSGSISIISIDPTSTPTGQGTETTTKKSSNVGATVGGIIGGLAILGALGVGALIFIRRRAAARIGRDHPNYPKYSAVASNSEHTMLPSQMRLYVSFFALVSSLYFDQC